MSIRIETLFTWKSKHNADSVEWCPIEPYLNFFVCGTYQLTQNENESDRIGNVCLFEFDSSSTEPPSPIQVVDTHGVLDQKWCNHRINGTPHLGVVTAKGTLQVYGLSKKDGRIELELYAESRTGDEELSNNIATSLDWSNNKYEDENPTIAVTDTSGCVSVFKYRSASRGLERVDCFTAHGFECWICAFNCWNPTVVYTGGDDCKLHMFDLNAGPKPQYTITRDMGVTSMHFNVANEYTLATGGYDEVLCVWDVRKLKTTIGDAKLGGGIWRLKWEPKQHNHLLAACMHGGFKIVNCSSDQLEVNAVYEDHDSLAYGADWCHRSNSTTCDLMATCSFYDCKLNISRLVYE